MEAASGALDDLLARARESVRALAALEDAGPASAGTGTAASASSSSASASRAKEASRLLRELERAIEVCVCHSDIAYIRVARFDRSTELNCISLNRPRPTKQYAQRAVAGEAGSESERAIALSRLQPVRAAWHSHASGLE